MAGCPSGSGARLGKWEYILCSQYPAAESVLALSGRDWPAVYIGWRRKDKVLCFGTDLGSDKRVLIRSDIVRFEIHQPGNNPITHLRLEANNRNIRCGSGGENWKFKFGDLLGKFGSTFIGTPAHGIHGAVTWGKGDDQDEWELC